MTALIHSAWQGKLTPRQAEVLQLLAEGLTDAQIAAEHCTCTSTVKHHLREVYLALGICARTTQEGPSKHCTRVLAARWWIENVERGCQL